MKYRYIALFLSLVMIAPLLSGCVTFRARRDYTKADNVASIDIYEIDDPEERYPEFLEDWEPTYTLEESQHEEFLAELAEFRFSNTIILIAANDPCFCYAPLVVRINFTDGSYRLISSHGYSRHYDANGEVIDGDHCGCDSEEWQAFVTKYLPDENSSKFPPLPSDGE